MKSFLLPIFLFTVVTTSSGQEKKGWPSGERYAFIVECVNAAKAGMSEDAARFYCYCMQEKVEKKYPTIEEASGLSNDERQSPAWQELIKSCRTGGSWTAKDRSDFLSNCISTAKAGIGDKKAKIYCECMLFKIETKHPDAEAAGKLTEAELASPEWKKMAQGCLDF